jgi:MFS family permease
MELIFAIPVILIPFAIPLVAGLMAQSFGRNFWFWFWLSFLLPVISYIILLCLPDKTIKKTLENNEVLDHQFEEISNNKFTYYEIGSSERA